MGLLSQWKFLVIECILKYFLKVFPESKTMNDLKEEEEA